MSDLPSLKNGGSLYTVEECADFVHCSTDWLRRRWANRQIEYVQIGRKRFMTAPQIEQTINDGRKPVMIPAPLAKVPDLTDGALARRGLKVAPQPKR